MGTTARRTAAISGSSGKAEVAMLESERDLEWIVRAAPDDPEARRAALGELMDAYGKDVWNYAFSITRKWDMADDITQEVFLKAFRHLHTFRHVASVRTWLLTITRNTAIDFMRSAFIRRVTLVDRPAERGQLRSAEQEVIERLAVNETWKQVLSLPRKYREVLVLFAHYQLTLKEMAEVLGVTVGTVKSRLFHARRKMMSLKEKASDG